jgi:hypothetical protein
MGDWRKLHNEELRNLHSSSYIIRLRVWKRMWWAGHLAWIGAKKNAYRIFVGKLERKRRLGRPIHRWVGNIKVDLREIGWDGMDWIDREQRRALVNTVVNLRVP